MSRMLKVISPKTVIGSIAMRMILKNLRDGEKMHLYRITGAVTGYDKGTSQYNEWYRFTGKFTCHNDVIAGTTIQKKTVTVLKCFLPEPINQLLVDIIEEGRSSKILTNVEIAVDIGVERKQTASDGAVGSEYTVHSLMDFSLPKNDPVQLLTDKFIDIVPEITRENRLLLLDKKPTALEEDRELPLF